MGPLIEAKVAEIAQRPKSLQTYIVGCDFDGTVTETNEFPRIGNIRPGIKELLLRLKAAGHDIILTSCRSGSYLTSAIQFIERQGLGCVFSAYNAQSKLAPPGLSGKLYVHFLLDDSATPGDFDVEAWANYLERIGVILPVTAKPGRQSKNRRT